MPIDTSKSKFFNESAYDGAENYYDYFQNTGGKPNDRAVGLARVLAGHDVRILLAGEEIGRAQSFSSRRDFGVESVYEIGSMKPQNFIPTRYRGEITLERYLVRYDDLVGVLQRANVPFSYSKEGRILLHSVAGIDIQVVDKYGDQASIRTFQNCVFSNIEEDFRAGAICGERATLFYSECVTELDNQ